LKAALSLSPQPSIASIVAEGDILANNGALHKINKRKLLIFENGGKGNSALDHVADNSSCRHFFEFKGLIRYASLSCASLTLFVSNQQRLLQRIVALIA
jgi:hypothetical protein